MTTKVMYPAHLPIVPTIDDEIIDQKATVINQILQARASSLNNESKLESLLRSINLGSKEARLLSRYKGRDDAFLAHLERLQKDLQSSQMQSTPGYDSTSPDSSCRKKVRMVKKKIVGRSFRGGKFDASKNDLLNTNDMEMNDEAQQVDDAEFC